MTDPYPHARLRELELIPYRHDGRPAVLLRDPEQVSQEILVIGASLAPLLVLLDGRHSVADLRADFLRRTGELVSADLVIQLIDRLDQACFLENSRFRQFRDQLVDEFCKAGIREPFHAGKSYPSDPLELSALLTSYYQDPGGAGLPASVSPRRIRGIVAPHIDFRIGGPTYTYPYRVLAESGGSDLFVILGIGHAGLPGHFSLSGKDFRTPLGLARTDRDLLHRLEQRLGDGSFGEDLSHRTEHTIEFQLVFLQHLFGAGNFTILPVLVGFSYLDLEVHARRQRIETFVQGLRDELLQLGNRACVIASVDLAHLGPRYGDPGRPDPGLREATLARDRQILAQVAEGSSQAFAGLIRDEGDRRRVCGFSAIYSLLALLPGTRGRLLALDCGQVDADGSFVTYAGMVFD